MKHEAFLSCVLACWGCFGIMLSVQAQPVRFSEDIRFAQYLGQQKLFDDAALHLANMEGRYAEVGQRDSIYFLAGTMFYGIKQLDTAALILARVGKEYTALYQSASLWRSYLLAHQGYPVEGQRLLDSLYGLDSGGLGLKQLELAGMQLLQRNYKEFDVLAQGFTGQHYAYAKQEQALLSIRADFSAHKYKSPWLAGGLSALVPGLGRVYAGRYGQGIATFATQGLLAAQAWEAYRKDGPGGWRFIVFGGIFSAFYVAQIYGSVLSVRVTQFEYDQAVDGSILLHMHVPLRTLLR